MRMSGLSRPATDGRMAMVVSPETCPHFTASIRRLGDRGPTLHRAVVNVDAPVARATWKIVP